MNENVEASGKSESTFSMQKRNRIGEMAFQCGFLVAGARFELTTFGL